MLVVETIGRIRREHLSKGKSIREIARDLKISRNTVRKIIRSDETALSYERQIQPRPKLGRWKADIDGMLAKNADARTSNPDPAIRRAEGAGLRRRLRRRPTLRQELEPRTREPDGDRLRSV